MTSLIFAFPDRHSTTCMHEDWEKKKVSEKIEREEEREMDLLVVASFFLPGYMSFSVTLPANPCGLPVSPFIYYFEESKRKRERGRFGARSQGRGRWFVRNSSSLRQVRADRYVSSPHFFLHSLSYNDDHSNHRLAFPYNSYFTLLIVFFHPGNGNE